jgi:catechol 2,3-dioxygenase-like lactoylglutathione lyase family enzyme
MNDELSAQCNPGSVRYPAFGSRHANILITHPSLPFVDAASNMEPQLLRIDHAQISIPINSESQARQFYCTLLGLKEVPKPATLTNRGGFWVALGDMHIHFGAEDGVDRRATKAHLAYQVQNLAEWRKVLIRNGIEVVEGIPIPGRNRFEFRDPFGNRVEFVERLASSL